jgi:hypothetical protein
MARSGNPYIGRKPKLKPSVVAYVDIVGYKQLVEKAYKKGKAEEFLKKLHHALKESHEHVDPGHANVFHSVRKPDFSAFSAFTDNIVIGYPTQFFGEEELGQAFRELSRFQMRLAINGFFVRGGISMGDLYMDDMVVYGPALFEAIEAERSLARDPRIVLANSAREKVDEHLKYYAVPAHAQHVTDLRKDADGQYFVNYLNTVVPGEWYFSENELEKHKLAIEDKLTQYEGEPRIYSKYLWSAAYHNYFCDNCPSLGVRMKIDIKNFMVAIRLIIE